MKHQANGLRFRTTGPPHLVSGRRMRIWLTVFLRALAAHVDPGVSSPVGMAPISIPSKLA